MTKNILIFAFIFSTLYQGLAQSTEGKSDSLQDATKKVNFTIGTGIALAPRYEGSDKYFVIPTIAFSADWLTGQYIRLSVAGIEANISKNRTWEFGPKASFVAPRNDSFVKTKTVNTLEELDFSVLMGAFGRYRFAKNFDFKAEYVQDITGVSNGGLATVEIGYTKIKNRWISNYVLSTSFATNKYMDTYFGVNPNNIGTSSLLLYNADAGFKDIGFRLTETFVLNQHWMLTYSFGYRYLIGDASNSPLVNAGSRNQFTGGIIAMYRF